MLVLSWPSALGKDPEPDASGVVETPGPAEPPRATAPARPRPGAVSPEMRERAVAAARRLRSERGRRVSERRQRDAFSRQRVEALEATGVLRSVRDDFVVTGFEHQPFALHKQGLPVFNRRGRLHRRSGRLAGRTGSLSFPLVNPEPRWIAGDEALAIAREHAGIRVERADPRLERGWWAREGGSIPAWRVRIPAREPFGTWQVLIDGRSGAVLASVDLVRRVEGTGRVYDPNPITNPTPALVPLYDLDGSGQLFGTATRVVDERAPTAYRPDQIFDFPTTDSRFIQTNVYRGLTNTARLAVAHGFPPFPAPVLAFANLGDVLGGEFNNAFYDPFFPLFGFGNGDGVITANLGVDLDVAAHEMGHHVFEELVRPLIFTGTEPVAAMTEGVADTFSALLGGDPDVGESTIPGQPYLRTLDNGRSFPGDVFADPHQTGLIYGGSSWDLILALGADPFADTLLAGLPFLPPSAEPPDYRDALLQGDQALTGGANASTIGAVFALRGFDSQENPPEFKGFLDDGVTVSGVIPDNGFDFYLYEEFPALLRIDVQTLDTAPFGDADLAVGPLSIIDIGNPATFLASETPFTSNEFVQVNATTTPSVLDDGIWVVFVVDWPDGKASGYELSASGQLPLIDLEIDGSPLVGSLDFAGEVEVAAFDGTAGQVVRLEAESLSATLDPLVLIVDPDDFSVLGADDDSGPGLDSLIQGALLPATKTYTVVILSPAVDIDPTVGTGIYRLHLTECANTGLDSDGDGLVDACDDDDDGDGNIDSQDLDPGDALVCQDIDGDGCDDCSGGGAADILADGPDTDFDILCDAGDPDDDNDGCPDPVDAAPLAPSADGDLDFVGEDCDNCPATANGDQTDTDTDGQGDACDDDDDGDGLDDTVETDTGTYVSPADTGTSPLVADTDGDGFSDGVEVAAGSDPTLATSVPATAVPGLGPGALGLLALALAAAGVAAPASREARRSGSRQGPL
ncbi:MAG: hypothetical protein QNK04_34735 [Myxococcota bacterium]|nr:hypothetical protein [Myxococcota bacterium]